MFAKENPFFLPLLPRFVFSSENDGGAVKLDTSMMQRFFLLPNCSQP
jgi:hypothetical protein